MSKTEIVVGVLGGAPYAGYLEFGTRHMPPRPFMRRTFEKDGAKMTAAIRAAYTKLHTGGSAYKEANRLGLRYEGYIKVNIRQGPWAPIYMETILRKGSGRILIDKGILIGAVSFTLR